MYTISLTVSDMFLCGELMKLEIMWEQEPMLEIDYSGEVEEWNRQSDANWDVALVRLCKRMDKVMEFLMGILVPTCSCTFWKHGVSGLTHPAYD